MPLERLRSVFASKYCNAGKHRRSATTPATKMIQSTIYSPCSWGSTHEDFGCLRFLVWNGGAPGFTLTTSRESENSGCASISDENSELKVGTVTALNVWEAGIRPGDVLETVAGKKVHAMDTEAAIVLVKMSNSPSIIRFRSSNCGNRIRFDVVLARQKLGVVFMGDGIRDVPVVTRVVGQSTHNVNGDFSSPSRVRVGDVLVAVNSKDAIAAGLDMTTKYLETCPRPARLTFERHEREGWCDSQSASEESKEYTSRFKSSQKAIRRISLPTISREESDFRCRELSQALKAPRAHRSAYTCFQEEKNKCYQKLKSSDIVIEWMDGPLGLTLVEDAISGAAVVNRLTGKGSSANLELLRYGFELMSINGKRFESLALNDLCRDLLALPKPVILVFRSHECDDISGKDEVFERCSSLYQENPSDSGGALKRNAHYDSAATSALQRICPQQASSLRNQHEYEVIWTSSQLGLQLEIFHDKSGRTATARRQYPIVHKILKNSTLDLPSHAVGHFFVSINNWDTLGLNSTELRTLLRLASRPVVLRFRTQGNSSDHKQTLLATTFHEKDEESVYGRNETITSTYSILWSGGRLGVLFACYEDLNRENTLVVYVKHIGPGQARRSKVVAVGDILISINGRCLPPKPKFKKTMRSLTNLKHPVTLGFRRLIVRD
ncbi:hypothetical protein CCR75_003105 [Bremia lactucae]|uniref:PDZ domain-containing protein n=1 Tax=Bremia lactucae TaxID=4779 RepID=A0A976FHH3_BRELC|nr:hypothetical protein CCR75_003105 [Bremia lactucae]